MKLICIALLLFLPLSAVLADDGDDKIEDTIKKIQEAEKEAEKDSGGSDDDEDGDSCLGAACQFFGEGCGEVFGEIFWYYLLSLRFAPYPYAEHCDFPYSTLTYEPMEDSKFVMLHAAADLSMHFDETYGNINRLSFNLSALHFNIYNQTIFSRSSSLSIVSINGGITLAIGIFDLTAFAGGYLVTTTDTFAGSAGISSKLFLPGKLYLDVYWLYAFLGDTADFMHVATSLNYALGRFSVGVGYNYNQIVGDIYTGPCLKAGFWL